MGAVARKIAMALTGLFLCLFLVIHLLGNLQLLLPMPTAQINYNWYSETLGGNPFIRIASLITTASIVLHVVISAGLAFTNRRARPDRYRVSHPGASSPWYSRHMELLGFVILAFLVIHLKTFWFEYHFGEVGVDAEGRRDLYGVVLWAFGRWWYVLLYVVAMFGLGFHLVHGFGAAWRTLGMYRRRYMILARRAGMAFGVVMAGAFAFLPVFIYVREWLQ